MARNWMAAVVIAGLAVAGCSADAREGEVEDAARAFVGATPAEACEMLAPETRKSVEKDSGTDCAAVLEELGLPSASDVEGGEVAGESAQVRLADDVVFLARFPEGWLVTAAGCVREEADPARPYECEVKA
ncbi:hypothetical protein H5392_05975 [Tessaracoccus sp. MC1865]|uniref:hypothetical protein n=1 Tax=Tessaracoccus sp. MC1865 TaxID=2760310 RepID=UPI001604854C|nr:hypothetical protein [Tessaracoccus sp. MC1865]MBB1483406.1 hypothetical protein [Tessaracoccus sp. MC1865]QTO36512.1 hypothetical protein J7D54_08350 [Tessaracoccus sp. MC1865]